MSVSIRIVDPHPAEAEIHRCNAWCRNGWHTCRISSSEEWTLGDLRLAVDGSIFEVRNLRPVARREGLGPREPVSLLGRLRAFRGRRPVLRYRIPERRVYLVTGEFLMTAPFTGLDRGVLLYNGKVIQDAVNPSPGFDRMGLSYVGVLDPGVLELRLETPGRPTFLTATTVAPAP